MFKSVKPGSAITTIPINPISTANHLYKPTFSFKKKIEKIVVKIGEAKDILTIVASGKFLNAVKIDNNAINPKKHLKKCNPALLVR